MKSYEAINYLLRTKKQIERKILVELLQGLGGKINIRDYRYFGFGSIYFADVILFHKYLGINNLTSIDRKVGDEDRFLFNVPYNNVTFAISDAHKYLTSTLNWNEKLFIWLDYDYLIDIEMLTDIVFIASKIKPDDVLIITSVVRPPSTPEDFIASFETKLSHNITEKDVKESFPQIILKLFNDAIKEGMANQTKTIEYLNLLNLEYQDGMNMLTIGGIFYKDDRESYINMVKNLSYISHHEHIVKIDCPILTAKEKIHLDRYIGDHANCNITGLDHEALDQYFKYYKYYPQYIESLF